jgi:hypothetical protein
MNPPKNLCLSAGTALLFFMWAGVTGLAQDASCIDVDYRALVSQSDLIYQSPAGRPVEGQPIGNGRMGTLVWTTPSAICFQINRNDVFAVNKNHAGTFMGTVDQCWGACTQIAIDVGGQPLVAGKAFAQRLSLYDAEVTVAGEAVGVRCFVSAATDILALEIEDKRPEPQPVRLTVSMWRAPKVTRESHVAQYEFVESTDSALVVQRFHEKDYHCASAVAARFVEDGTQVQASGERARTVVAPAKKGKRAILISSAASWAPGGDVGKTAVELLGTAGKRTYDDLFKEHTRWWRNFWSRTFVHLASKDGLAEFMQQIRYLQLYYMASSSRGTLPPKWNGSLFITDGDARSWGSQFWVWTTEMLYFPLLAADANDLAEPFFNMYVRQLPDCKKAARQRWNVKGGAFFPETTSFDGPVVLPDDVVQEYRDIFFGRKDPKSISVRLKSIGSFEGHLDAVTHHAVSKQYSYITHVASSGSELAVQAWWRYRYTGDTLWLRTHAYPLLRGTVEFYRHLLKKDQDGRYHLYGTNAHEDFWGLKDSIMDLAAIRGTAPLAIRAAEILGVDAQLRDQWKEMLDNLTPYPMGSDPQSETLKDGVLADNVWAVGRLGDLNDGHRNSEDVWLTPVFPFEDWTLETRSPPVDKIIQKALELAPRHQSVLHGEAINTAIRMPIVVARAGRGQELPVTLASYYAVLGPNVPNGMSLFEAVSDPSIEHLGLISTALQEGLLQSVSARPGGPEIISVFPAWPKQWEASFRLLARGGFLVTAAVRGGKVEFVEIESRLGETCRLRNPWDTPCQVAEIGGRTWSLGGDLLSFDTAQGKRYRVVPKDGATPALRRIVPAPINEPTSYSFNLSNGKTVTGTLGRRK